MYVCMYVSYVCMVSMETVLYSIQQRRGVGGEKKSLFFLASQVAADQHIHSFLPT